MANPEVDRLIQELSMILEQNRQKRNAADAMLQGVAQGKRAAAMSEPRTPVSNRSAPGAQAGLASQYDSTGYIKHNNKMYKDDENGGLGTLSPNYRSSGDKSFAERYARATSGPYGFLEDNEAPAPMRTPTDQGILDEQKKRFTQNLMLSRGESGGPLGGAGQAPDLNKPTTAGIDPSVVNAVSGAGGPVAPINPGPAPAAVSGASPPPANPFAGVANQPIDTALLDAMRQRYLEKGGGA